jgi:hypothetical protein
MAICRGTQSSLLAEWKGARHAYFDTADMLTWISECACLRRLKAATRSQLQ